MSTKKLLAIAIPAASLLAAGAIAVRHAADATPAIDWPDAQREAAFERWLAPLVVTHRLQRASLRRFVLGDQGGDGVHATDPSGTRISAQTPRPSAAGDRTKAARAP